MSPSRWPSFAGLGLGQQRGALGIGLQHRVQQADVAARRFLRHRADPGAGHQLMSPPSACSWPRITLSRVDLPAPLRPTRPTASRREGRAGARTGRARDADGKIGDVKHVAAAFSTRNGQKPRQMAVLPPSNPAL